MNRRIARTTASLLLLGLLASAAVAEAAPKVATIEVKGMVCNA
jgi:hypothetical protein